MHLDHDHHDHHDHHEGETHTHPHTHTYEHTHEHDHASGEHEHTHTHTYEHTHEHSSHEHTHDHAHEHDHAHDHTHSHCDHGCDGCATPCEHTPMEELTALMKYMVGHNAAHANELAQLAKQLEDAGNHMAYEQVMAAVSDFEKGNLRLSALLASLDVK